MSDQIAKNQSESYSAQYFSSTLTFTGAFTLSNVPVTYIVTSLAPTVTPYRARVEITIDQEVTTAIAANTPAVLLSTPIPAQLRPPFQTASTTNIVSASFNGLSSCFIDPNGIITVRSPDQATPWALGTCGLARGTLAHYYI